MVSILPKFRNKILLVVSKLLKTGSREEGRFVRQMKVTASDIGLWNWKSNLVVCEARGLLSAVQVPCNPLHFTFCWPASRYIHLKRTNLIQNLPSVYFVKHLYMFRAYPYPSTGGTTVYIQHWVLIILLRWQSSNKTNK